jgi:hypothetical protein
MPEGLFASHGVSSTPRAGPADKYRAKRHPVDRAPTQKKLNGASSDIVAMDAPP